MSSGRAWNRGNKVDSDREDLEAQLRTQESVNGDVREEIHKVRELTEEFKELLIQLQKKGRFLEATAVSPNEGEEEELSEDYLQEIAKENKMLAVEIEALKAQLDEVEDDSKQVSERLERTDSISHQVEDPPVGETREEIDDLEASIRATVDEIDNMIVDLNFAKADKRSFSLTVEREKIRAKSLNEDFLALLNAPKGFEVADIDQILAESIDLRSKLDRHQEEATMAKSYALSTRKVAKRHSKPKTIGEVGMALEAMAGGDNTEIEQNVALVLLETLLRNDKLIATEKSANKTLGKRLAKLASAIPEDELGRDDDAVPSKKDQPISDPICTHDVDRISFQQPLLESPQGNLAARGTKLT